MEWVAWIIILFTLFDLESKVSKLSKQQNSQKKFDTFLLEEYKGKNVSLMISNDDIENSYLFDGLTKTEGKIVDFDDTWLVFEYIHQNEKNYQYFRIQDITSINEIEKSDR